MPRPARPAPGRAWPFTGRDAELRAVASLLERDGVVVVAGAAGVGKSRLARELVARAATEETVAVATASASSREVPLGAFAPWLDADDETGAVSALARVGAALRAEGPRMLLLVDDAHMLDDVSATLVHQLAVEHAVRLVLTVRTGEPCPEAITAVWKDGVGERVEMEPLAPDEAADLLGAALGGPLDARAQRRLHDTTLGNVLWLRHLVDGERAAQRLVAVDGHWEWHGPVALSPALEHLLVERIGTLDEGERHVLDLVALGEPVGLGLLTELATAGDVERVAERELIRVVTAGARSEVHLAHPLYGEVTRARLSVPRARRLRGEISRALRATGARRAGDDLRRAVLDLDSDTPPDATLLMLAAEQAMNLTDFALAERLLRAAADGVGGFDAHLGLGFLLAWMMRAEEAETALATATAAAATEAERARAVLARAHVLMFILDRGDDARALLDREGVDAAGAPLPESLAFRAALLVGSGDVGPGIETATSALDRPGASPQTSTWACWAAAYGEAFAGGRSDRVRELVARGMDAARRAPELGAMLGNLGFAEILDAGYSGVLDGPSARLAWVDDLPGQHGATWSALYHGRLALEAGRAATARRLLESILPTFPGHGGGWTAWFHAMIAQARAQLGDADGAAESLRHSEQTRHPVLRADEGDAALAHVWIAAARGSAHEAVAAARRLSVTAASRGQRALELVARHAAVRAGDRDQEAPLRALAETLGTPRARAAAVHAAGLAAQDPHALLAAADDLEACGLLLAAADAAAHAAGAARDQGQLALGGDAADRAGALAERCEGASTPALALARAPLPVSSREREVAVLAAEGLSNRQIAARLHVSVRTVESHIYRACTRLGLADRAALAAAVVPSRRS
ncbi:helix-turn-helix transcriptional regulator [Actinomycetospora callitridis]|uniref:helix-turn-helix transcriptional regulator n=1 Tax=Actinomycetospora callitridis TaxID=913944 RepID=UPI002366642A|nr:LuxR family transcriptional regulator [Actinomycetospora callitridis]MDD7921431.1 LuxR C-terminal-related transcriptional regulator [Actinomycetospora callitridis]